MKIPNGANANIPKDKIEGYCLTMEHKDGKHKALIFREKYGITNQNSDILYSALRYAITQYDYYGNPEYTLYGTKYLLYFEMQKLDGTFGIICSAWIIDSDSFVPRLITCFPKEGYL